MAHQANLEAVVEASLLQAAQIAEKQVDEELKSLDNIEEIRRKRLAALKKEQESKMEFIRMG